MKTQASIKERGAHFTPSDIANYIAERSLSMLELPNEQDNVIILDPACGDGELLIAAYKIASRWNKKVTLIGIDSDFVTLESAKNRISPLLKNSDILDLRCTNFLDCTSNQITAPFDEQNKNDVSIRVLPLADLVIANPPYVRTQVMGANSSQRLSKKYNLKGKVDLYHAFFLSYINFLKPNGVLGVITSNRYLYTKSGSMVRKYLDQDYDIDLVIDLGDTKIFSAAVLPAILFAKPRTSNLHSASCIRVYETSSDCNAIPVKSVSEMLVKEDGIFSICGKNFKKESGHVRNTTIYQEPWILASSEQEIWLDKIDSAAFCRIKDIGRVHVGVKTTADNVFIRDDWDSLEQEKPEKEWVRPLISSGNTHRWRASQESNHQILYPYYSENGKRCVASLSEYPHMKNYLESFYDQLSGRSYVTKAKRQWYEIWVPQDPSAWTSPKVVFPDISNEARFLVDESGAIVDGNCYWIQVDNQESDLLYLIAAVANSSLMDRYHSLAFQNVLYSGKRRFLTQYVSQYPIPDPQSEESQEIVKYVKSAITNNSPIDEEYVDTLVERAFAAN